jgi:hypothetical protein
LRPEGPPLLGLPQSHGVDLIVVPRPPPPSASGRDAPWTSTKFIGRRLSPPALGTDNIFRNGDGSTGALHQDQKLACVDTCSSAASFAAGQQAMIASCTAIAESIGRALNVAVVTSSDTRPSIAAGVMTWCNVVELITHRIGPARIRKKTQPRRLRL